MERPVLGVAGRQLATELTSSVKGGLWVMLNRNGTLLGHSAGARGKEEVGFAGFSASIPEQGKDRWVWSWRQQRTKGTCNLLASRKVTPSLKAHPFLHPGQSAYAGSEEHRDVSGSSTEEKQPLSLHMWVPSCPLTSPEAPTQCSDTFNLSP